MAKIFVDNTDNTVVGVDKFHFSVLETDTPDYIKYGDMYDVPGSIEISATPTVVSESLYADNVAVIVYTATSGVEVTVERTNLPDEILAVLLGNQVDGAIRHVNSGAKSPYVGIAWRQSYSDGSYGYVKLFKGKFQEPENISRTREEGIEFQTRTLTGSFTETRFRHTNGDEEFPLMMIGVTENHPDYDGEGDTWFDQIFETTAAKWEAGKTYGKGNYVEHDGTIYRATVSHEASSDFASDKANWEEVK